MLDKVFRTKKVQPNAMEMVLAQARRHLWLNDVDQARQLFVQVATKVQEEIKKSKAPDPSYALLQFQAHLGLWAVSYLYNPEERSGLTPLIGDRGLSVETAHFIAKVFQIKSDVSTDALKAYRSLIKLDSSPKIARQVRDMVIGITFCDVALALYITLTTIFPDDMTLSGKLCRWHLLANDRNNARELAYRITQNDPSNRDANRCLAVIAEQNKDWKAAAHYYRLSCDLLRLAVVLTKAHQLDTALKVLYSMPNVEQNTSTWLYYRGWIAYQQGEVTSALTHWATLLKANPQASNILQDSLNCLRQHAYYEHLQNRDVSDEAINELDSTGVDVSILEAWKGAIALLCHINLPKGRSLLQRAVRKQKNNIRIVSYVALAEAQESQDMVRDRQLYQQLSTHYRDTSLFMWLRGLILLREGNSAGVQYLQKSYSDGICDRHLPIEAIQSANWLVSQISGNTLSDSIQGRIKDLDITQFHQLSAATNSFIWAIASSYTLAILQRNEPVRWIAAQSPINTIAPVWRKVQAAYYLHQKDWSASLSLLPSSERSLQWHIISLAMREALRQQDWLALSSYVDQGLAIIHDHPQLKKLQQQLLTQMYQLLWQRGEFERLDYKLETGVHAGNASPTVYHGLAIVYTRLAVIKDQQAASVGNNQIAYTFTQEGHRTKARYAGFLEDQAHNDYWQLAIGYWAVILSDNTYWDNWRAGRSAVYGETITNNQMNELITRTLPQMLRDYHEEQIHAGSLFSVHHHFYAAIINHEIETARAMRYVMRKASSNRLIPLPSAIQNFISPLLIKEYGYSELARTFLEQINKQQISPYEIELVRFSFSPMSDIKALAAIKAYDIALNALRGHLANPSYAAMRHEFNHELNHILELIATQHIDLEKWDTALQFAREGQTLQPQNEELQQLTVKAVIGLANTYFREGMLYNAIEVLEDVRSSLQHSYTDLDILLSETYIEWGYEAGRDEDYDKVIYRLNKAISILPSNERANLGLNVAYYHRAIAKAQDDEFYDALEDAEQAIRCQEDAETLVLLAKLHRTIAVDLDTSNDFEQGSRHWEAAADYAVRQLKLEDTEKSLGFFVDITVSRIFSLYSQNSYAAAIDLTEELMDIVDDISLYRINPYELLSEMCTNYGAKLYNSGHREQGILFIRKALKYNPNNQVALNNINMM